MRAIIESALHALSCTDLSDAMDRLGIAGQCAGIMPLDRSLARQILEARDARV
jgi:hypothetical protein